ncbi:glutaredoxin family protein [Fusobacterium gonidiaformans]|uniref:glutaredoxin family protein n=1 Tax=Fusobacterium gonidiaformans TaxID=849 RepID=UPI0023F08A18|nr:thioredoxin family protein [Fusobacterium gonidiaformans]
MKKLYMFVTSWCPHCKNAKNWIQELKAENPKYETIPLEIIDEEKEVNKVNELNFDYYYVPTFFLEDEKLHEGVPSKEIVKSVLDKALQG